MSEKLTLSPPFLEPRVSRLGRGLALRPTLLSLTLILLFMVPEKYAFVVAVALSSFVLVGTVLQLTRRCSVLDLLVIFFGVLVLGGLLRLDYSASLGVVFYSVTAFSSLSLILSYRLFSKEDFEGLIGSVVAFAGIEAVLIYILWFFEGFPQPGDWAHVLLGNAHVSGIIIAIALLYLLATTVSRKNRRGMALVLLYLGALTLTATKQAMLAFPLALGLLALFLMRRNRLLILTVCVLLCYPVIQLAAKMLNPDAPKVAGYLRTFQAFQENPQRILFGFGAGNFGSRASVARSDSQDLAKEAGNRVPAALVGTPPVLKHYVADLYSPEYLDHLINVVGNTGTFYTPFSTWNAILAEFGVVGFVCFSAIFLSVFRRAVRLIRVHRLGASVALTTAIATGGFCLLFAYDNWLEYPKIMVVYWLFAAYTLRLGREGVPTMHPTRTGSST